MVDRVVHHCCGSRGVLLVLSHRHLVRSMFPVVGDSAKGNGYNEQNAEGENRSFLCRGHDVGLGKAFQFRAEGSVFVRHTEFTVGSGERGFACAFVAVDEVGAMSSVLARVRLAFVEVH